jgi:hypothetical protein
MAFDANPASATMNSYTSVEFADDYFALHFKGNEAWIAFTTSQKQSLLVSATTILDTFSYGGLKTVRTQPLQWPRQGIYDDEGNAYSSADQPFKVKQATCELAYWIWTEGDRTLDDTTVTQYESFSAGPLTVKMRKPVSYPQNVLDLLNSVGTGTLLSTGKSGATSLNMAL